MNDAGTQRRLPVNRKHLLLWTIFVGAGLVLLGDSMGRYVAVVAVASVIAMAAMRRFVGLWAAYLTAVTIAAVGFFWVISHTGGPPEDLRQLQEEVLLCLALGAVLGGPVALGATCLLQLVVDLLVLSTPPRSATSMSDDVPTPREFIEEED